MPKESAGSARDEGSFLGACSRRRLLATAPAFAALGACALTPGQKLEGAGQAWADAIGAFEHGDSGRTGLFDAFDPQARAGDSAQIASLPEMTGVWNAAFDAKGRGFALHGVLGGDAGAKPLVSAFDPAAMRETRRLVLPMAEGKPWIYPGGVAVHQNGFAYAAYCSRLAKIDPDALEVKAVVDLPTPNGIEGTTYNGFIALADGRILAKSHHRKLDCPYPGFRALIECGVDGLPPSALVLLDPQDLKPLWRGDAPELIGGRVSSVVWRGREYVYLAGTDSVHRLVRDGDALKPDASWGPAPYRSGQAKPGTAVVAFGDYVVIQDNALPSKAALSVRVISQENAARTWSLQPFADQGADQSFMPSKVSADARNGRLYCADAHAGLAALDFSPGKGLVRAWVKRYRTGSFLTLMGPKDRRVLAVSAIENPTYDGLGAPTHRLETCRWLEAQTGRDLADISGLPRNFGLTLTPGPLSALYYATRTQGLYRLIPKRF